MFWNLWNLILWREAGNKRSNFSEYSKNGSFVIGQSEQQFKIKSYFVIFDPTIGEGGLYDDVALRALKCVCESIFPI